MKKRRDVEERATIIEKDVKTKKNVKNLISFSWLNFVKTQIFENCWLSLKLGRKGEFRKPKFSKIKAIIQCRRPLFYLSS